MSSQLNVLSGTVLKKHLQSGVEGSALLGKICVEMLEEAVSLSHATSGVGTNQSLAFRINTCLRLTFSALDYIGCDVNEDCMSDFERMDLNILLAHAGQGCVDKATWLMNDYLKVYVHNQEFDVRLMVVWNDLKHSAPDFVALEVYDGKFYFVIGDVWFAVADVTNYVSQANKFARQYFWSTGYEI